VNVWELVGSDDSRADRSERVESFAHEPLSAVPLELPVTGTHVVCNSVAAASRPSIPTPAKSHRQLSVR
jgi:hypothetical protein